MQPTAAARPPPERTPSPRVQSRRETPRSSDRAVDGEPETVRGRGGAPIVLQVGTQVELFHTQNKEWQLGVIAAVSALEYGRDWHRAEGWRTGWKDQDVASVQVHALDSGARLNWDARCRDALPRHFFSTMLRAPSDFVDVPRSAEDSERFREQEVLAAALAKKSTLGAGQVPEEAWKSTADFMDKLNTEVRLGDRALPGTHHATSNLLTRNLHSKQFQESAAFLSNGAETATASLAFADMAGRMAATDAGCSAYLKSMGLLGPAACPRPTPLDLMSAPGDDQAIAELRSMPPFLKQFMWAFASLQYRPPREEKRGNMLHPRGTDDKTVAARAVRLLPVFGIMFSSGGDWSDLNKLSVWRKRIAVVLQLEGVSEKTLRSIKIDMQAIDSSRSARR